MEHLENVSGLNIVTIDNAQKRTYQFYILTIGKIYMKLRDCLSLLGQLIVYKLTQNRYDIDYRPDDLDPGLFISARQAIESISDGDTVISTGMASHGRCAIFFYAFRDVFKKKKHPAHLTWVTVSAQGGRGKVGGTLEDLAIPGLVDEYITGHIETAKAMLKLGQKGKIRLHILPQGELTALLVAQARGRLSLESPTGIGTFLDPILGGTSELTPDTGKSYVDRKGDTLIYSLPKLQKAFLMAPYADRKGNIYHRHASSITENIEAVDAVIANGGKVFVTVSGIIDTCEKDIAIPGEKVSGIVVNPWNDQAGAVRQRKYWPLFTQGAQEDTDEALQKLKIINTLAMITPRRGPVENAMARIAASLFTREAHKGDLINLGVGLPEEVGRLLYEGGLHRDLTFSSETGVVGGIPTSGLFFGGAVNPERIMSSAWIFNHYKTHLPITVLGFLQVDSKGNVNVSKRGKKIIDYVGPGGFMNISSSARTIIFIGHFAANAKYKMKNGLLKIRRKGCCKFTDDVLEVTFNAQDALAQGKKIYYVTTLGMLELTEKGLVLVAVMPGVDIQKDIVDHATARILIPENVTTVSPNLVTGEGFNLCWPETASTGQQCTNAA